MMNLRKITPFRIATALSLCGALYFTVLVPFAEDWYKWYIVVPLVFLALVLFIADWPMRRFIQNTSVLLFVQLCLLGLVVILYGEGCH